MAEFEQKCYGMTEEDIREEYINGITGRLSGIEMVVASIPSDCQEMLEMGHDKEAHIRLLAIHLQETRILVKIRDSSLLFLRLRCLLSRLLLLKQRAIHLYSL